MLVLVQHLFETRPNSVLMPFIRLGPGVAGVALFFFISGFVIPLSASPPFDPRRFMVRRVFRIYPLFLAALALIFFAGRTELLPRWHDMGEASAFRWIANLTLIQEFVGARPFLGVSWTLAIEIIWYALFAVALLVWRERAAVRLDRLVPISLVVLTLASLVIGMRIPLGRPTMIYAAVLGYQCFRHGAGQIGARQLALSVLRFCGVTLFASAVAFGHFHHPTITLAQDIGPWALSLAIFLLVTLLPSLRDAAVLNAGLLPTLGTISYSIYLLHPIVINAADLYFAPTLREVGAFFGTLVLAALAYRVVEQPGIAAGRRLALRWFPSNPMEHRLSAL